MSVEMLTYAALGARLKVSPEAARSLATRLRLPRSRAPDGKALVSVDLAEIRHTPRPPSTRQAGNIALLATKIETWQAEIARLETMVSAKEATARLEGELAALRTGDRAASAQAQAARRLGHLAASIVEADRKACSNNSGPLIQSSLEQP
jgi:hypothetical protein